ncbi:MAG TPA: tRNA (N6-isopentenyl adenosine(37)-C2)-methylthiotransferase MiaB [Clostridiales bacterium]|nr:tRNA (N6-isopentenyl adenosine(37)-C2)-methylthiotransferase MiaB [Clostridiales bacterium]
MEKRENITVSLEEIKAQKKYTSLVKQINQGSVKKYHITTFGCQMNENDSEKLAGMLSLMGYEETDDINESDIILYNTCCVRENAEMKVFGHLGALKKVKRENPDTVIAVCGCMMQQEEVVEKIKKKYRNVDLIFGTHNLYKFPELLYSVLKDKHRLYDIWWDTEGQIAEDLPVLRKDGIKAWVSIMYGCNNFCSYCIVPYVRGRERSRRPEDIINEVRMLGQQGYKEITLLGQNVNSYGKDIEGYPDFSKLLYEVDAIETIERIRFMTSHPKDLSDDLIKAMRECKKVCEHLHLPVQSGSSRILKEMNRRYTKEKYLELIDKVKVNIPGISITTDIIVGFPGENDEDFQDTLDVIKRVQYDTAYTFIYSIRKGTPAADRKDQVPEEVKKARFEELLEVQNAISKKINDKLLGKDLEVLVEGPSKTNPGIYTGRTCTNKIVNFQGNEDLIIGSLRTVKIEKVQTWSLEGTLLK